MMNQMILNKLDCNKLLKEREKEEDFLVAESFFEIGDDIAECREIAKVLGINNTEINENENDREPKRIFRCA